MLIERNLKRPGYTVVSESETEFDEPLNLIVKKWLLLIITL